MTSKDDLDYNVDLRVGRKKIKQHIAIGCIGEPGVGKSTCLAFLAELLFEMGYHDTVGINAKEAWSLKLKNPSWILIDNINNLNEAIELKEKGKVLFINVHWSASDNPDKADYRPKTNCHLFPFHYRIYNRNNLRLFKFELRDLLETQIIPKIKERL